MHFVKTPEIYFFARLAKCEKADAVRFFALFIPLKNDDMRQKIKFFAI